MPKPRHIDGARVRDLSIEYAKNVLRTVQFSQDDFEELMKAALLEISKAYCSGYLQCDKDARL